MIAECRRSQNKEEQAFLMSHWNWLHRHPLLANVYKASICHTEKNENVKRGVAITALVVDGMGGGTNQILFHVLIMKIVL